MFFWANHSSVLTWCYSLSFSTDETAHLERGAGILTIPPSHAPSRSLRAHPQALHLTRQPPSQVWLACLVAKNLEKQNGLFQMSRPVDVGLCAYSSTEHPGAVLAQEMSCVESLSLLREINDTLPQSPGWEQGRTLNFKSFFLSRQSFPVPLILCHIPPHTLEDSVTSGCPGANTSSLFP